MRIYVATTDNLDHAFADNRRPGTEFVLQAGTHWTRGAWWHGQNWERVRAPHTIVRPEDGPWEIRLHPDAPRSDTTQPRPERDVWAMTGGEGGAWKGGTIHGNQAGLPDVFVKAALRSFATEFNDMSFGGCRGDFAKQIEAFPLSLVGSGASRLVGLTQIIDCAPDSYVSAVNFGHIGGDGITSVDRVFVDIGDGNWFAFGVNERVEIQSGEVKSKLKNLVYNDTGRTDGVRVRDVRMSSGVQRVLSLVVKPGDPSFKGNVSLDGIRGPVLADENGDARLIEVWDQAAMGSTGAVLATNCVLTSTAKRFFAVSGVTSRNAPLLVANSRLPKGALINGKGSILNCIME